jgi:flagellar protein FliJ
MDSIALLTSLLQRAEAERDTAITVLRQAEAQQAQAQAQADQLQAYRQDFDQRWTLRFRQSGARELLDCRQAFGERLQQAITGQASQTSQMANRVALARKALLQREQRVGAVRKLIERRAAELARIAQRRDQRANDETAQRQHLRRMQASI